MQQGGTGTDGGGGGSGSRLDPASAIVSDSLDPSSDAYAPRWSAPRSLLGNNRVPDPVSSGKSAEMRFDTRALAIVCSPISRCRLLTVYRIPARHQGHFLRVTRACYFRRYYLLAKNHAQETLLHGGKAKGACAAVPRGKAPPAPSDTTPPEDPGEQKQCLNQRCHCEIHAPTTFVGPSASGVGLFSSNIYGCPTPTTSPTPFFFFQQYSPCSLPLFHSHVDNQRDRCCGDHAHAQRSRSMTANMRAGSRRRMCIFAPTFFPATPPRRRWGRGVFYRCATLSNGEAHESLHARLSSIAARFVFTFGASKEIWLVYVRSTFSFSCLAWPGGRATRSLPHSHDRFPRSRDAAGWAGGYTVPATLAFIHAMIPTGTE